MKDLTELIKIIADKLDLHTHSFHDPVDKRINLTDLSTMTDGSRYVVKGNNEYFIYQRNSETNILMHKMKIGDIVFIKDEDKEYRLKIKNSVQELVSTESVGIGNVDALRYYSGTSTEFLDTAISTYPARSAVLVNNNLHPELFIQTGTDKNNKDHWTKVTITGSGSSTPITNYIKYYSNLATAFGDTTIHSGELILIYNKFYKYNGGDRTDSRSYTEVSTPVSEIISEDGISTITFEVNTDANNGINLNINQAGVKKSFLNIENGKLSTVVDGTKKELAFKDNVATTEGTNDDGQTIVNTTWYKGFYHSNTMVLGIQAKKATGSWSMILGPTTSAVGETLDATTSSLQLGVSGTSLTKSVGTTLFGAASLLGLKESYYNTVIGSNSLTNFTVHDKALSELTSLFPLYEANSYVKALTNYTMNVQNDRIKTGGNTILGANNLFNNCSVTRSYWLTIVGSGNGEANAFQYRMVNTLIFGNGNWSKQVNRLITNSVIIGSFNRLDFMDGMLVINHSYNQVDHISDALILGSFKEKWLKINGNLRLKLESNPDATDLTDHKVLVVDKLGQVRTTALTNVGGGGSSSTEIPEILNKLKGKKLSFIGDSITNYGDTSTEYNTTTGYTFDDTWVGQLLKLTGGIKHGISAVSGTYVTGTNDPHAFAFKRTRSVPQDSDCIFVFMGANDQRMNKGIGNKARKKSLGVISESNARLQDFTGAYQLAIEDMMSYYKNSQIILMTPLKSYNQGSTDDMNQDGDKYGNRIQELGKLYGLPVIDTRDIGFTNWNNDVYYVDGLHPNKLGHKRLAEFVIDNVNKFGVLVQGSGNIDAYTKPEVDAKLKVITDLLQSDDTNLDQLQELVNYIKANRTTLDDLVNNKIQGILKGTDTGIDKDKWKELLGATQASGNLNIKGNDFD